MSILTISKSKPPNEFEQEFFQVVEFSNEDKVIELETKLYFCYRDNKIEELVDG